MESDVDHDVYVGDAVTVLKSVPSETFHVCLTSPPYYQKREYGYESEVGTEVTVTRYLDRLEEIFSEVYRTLRDDGSLFLNIGDTWERKSLCRVPHRLVERLVNECDYIHRQTLVWAKPNNKPDPARDRRQQTHEYVFHLTKSRNYWYDETVTGGGHESVLCSNTASHDGDHTAPFSEQFVRELLEPVIPRAVCGRCGTPYERTYEEVPRPMADPERIQSVRAREIYEDSKLTEDHLDAIRAVGISDVGKATQTEDGAGRNTDEVEQLATEAKEVLGGYYREFTMTERIPDTWEQDCVCQAGTGRSRVCDPFLGSGTTLEVADEMGASTLGVELYEKYVRQFEDHSRVQVNHAK
jgi:hypothetical protein